MEQGHALVALIAIPLLTAALLVLIPSERKDLVRQLAVLSGAVWAWSGDQAPARAAGEAFPMLYKTFRNKFYIDDFYQWTINNVVLGFAKIIAYFDRAVVNDTGINGPGEVANGVGFMLKLQQTGKLPNYALAMVLGVVVIAIVGYSVRG